MTTDPVTVLIADDHPLIRQALRQTLSGVEDLTIVAEAENGEEAIRKIGDLKPHVAILDVQMPRKTGVEIAAYVRDHNLPVSVVFLTMHQDEDLFNRAMDLGVRGFVLKENSAHDIVDCVRTVHAGKYYISPLISDYLLKRRAGVSAFATANPAFDCLTPTERTILRLVAEQKTSKQIAEFLHVSVRTVENHRTNIVNKLNLRGNNALLKFAIEHRSHLIAE